MTIVQGKRYWRAALCLAMLAAPLAASAQAGASVQAAPSVQAANLTAADLDTFLDGVMPFAMARGDVAGAVISVVKDGQILFAKGYGYADLQTRRPMSGETSLVRPGSISKLFTWTAVMQLVEQGKLNLDADVNTYLDFRIPKTFDKPITLRNLLTHTAGFEEAARGTAVGNLESLQAFDFAHYLKTSLPARIFPPGEITAYSNYGCALAGYIVQRISGEKFADYIAAHIFAPLQMAHSTFIEPLPPALAPLVSQGYLLASGRTVYPFELMTPPPAGALTSSATDMAHFMLAHLQDGRFGEARILEAKTAQLMHSQQIALAPGLNGVDLGFYQEDRNGQRIIGHGGDITAFHSDLHLLLDAQVGFFISFNSQGNGGGADLIRSAVFHAFLDRYFPAVNPDQPALPSAKADAQRVAGAYMLSRRAQSGVRLLHVLLQVEVRGMPDGTITVPALTGLDGQPKVWREVGPLRYREVGGQGQLAFVTGKGGEISYWTTDEYPAVLVFQRIGGLVTQSATSWLVGLSCLVLLATLLVWILGRRMRKHYDRTLTLTTLERRLRLAARIAALILLAVIVDWTLFLLIGVSGSSKDFVAGGYDRWLTSLYILGVVALLGASLVMLNTAVVWMGRRRGIMLRIGEGLLAATALYVGWLILFYGLAGFSYKY